MTGHYEKLAEKLLRDLYKYGRGAQIRWLARALRESAATGLVREPSWNERMAKEQTDWYRARASYLEKNRTD